MCKNSLILNSLNKILEYSQNKCSYLSENSFFLKNIDNLIFSTILAIFVLSTFAVSDLIGYAGLIVIFLTIVKLFVKKDEKISINLFEFFLIIYFLIVVISLAGSSLFYLSFKGFMKTFTYIGFYFSAAQYFKNNLTKIPLTIFIIALCAGSQGIIGIFQNFSQVGEISTWQDITNINPEDVMTRVYGSLQPYNPNLYGGYLVASLPCLLGSFVLNILDKKYKISSIFLILSLITSFSLILSGCRGAYLGFLAIMVCFFGFLAKFIWLNNKEILKKIYLSVLGLIVAISISVILFVSSIKTRILSIFAMRGDSSTSFRFNVYQSAINMIKDNWPIGIGVGNQNFREIYGLYMRTGFDALSAYNVFLEIAVESGIFALLAFLLFLGTLGHRAIKFILNSEDLELSAIAAIALTSIIVVMIHGLVDTIFFRPQVQFIFWTMVAFMSAMGSNYKVGDLNG